MFASSTPHQPRSFISALVLCLVLVMAVPVDATAARLNKQQVKDRVLKHKFQSWGGVSKWNFKSYKKKVHITSRTRGYDEKWRTRVNNKGKLVITHKLGGKYKYIIRQKGTTSRFTFKPEGGSKFYLYRR